MDGIGMIRLVATDIDGTLIEESTSELYPEIISEIGRLSHNGILFCAASGRQLFSLKNLFRNVPEKICYIAENGAHIHYNGRDLFVTPMEREYVEQIVCQLRGVGKAYEFIVSTPKGSLMETKNQGFVDMIRDGYGNRFRLVEDVLAEALPILKVAVYHPGSIRALGEERLIPAWSGRVQACVAGEEWVDFMDQSVDKGMGLEKVQEFFGILPEETMAFGDNSNDIGLMKAAGYSYAVENARPEVKRAARFSCPSYREKGVYTTIHKMCGD